MRLAERLAGFALLIACVTGCSRGTADPRDLDPATVTRGDLGPRGEPARRLPDLGNSAGSPRGGERTDPRRGTILESVSAREPDRAGREPRPELTPTRPSGRPAPESFGLPENVGVYFSQVTESVERNRVNPENIADKAVAVIATARESLDVCGFEIDNERIIRAILAAHARRVKVRVVCERDYLDERGPKAFEEAGIPLVPDDRDDLMHHKFLIVDRRVVWTGSTNFTENCCYRNNNNSIAIIDERLAETYGEKFRWFFELRKFGGRPNPAAKLPFSEIALADGSRAEVYFSTHDRIDRHVVSALRQARRSIRFMAFSFTHAGIADAMMEAASAGVSVTGVIEARQNSGSSQFNRLIQHGSIDVRLDGNPSNMHHKVIIIDDRLVITGSFNFSMSASTGNDENMLFLHNPAIAAAYGHEFLTVFERAEPPVVTSRSISRYR